MKQPLVLLVGLVVAASACHLLLPESLRVNAPIGHLLFGWGVPPPPESAVRARLSLPRGFTVSIYARELQGARMLRFTPHGDLLVSTPRSGEIHLVERSPSGDDRRAGAVHVLLAGLSRPHGLDLHDGWLYVAEGDAISRIRFDSASRQVSGEVERIVEGIPSGGNHWSRTIRFGPDGGLYLSVGSSCNVCVEDDPRRATILRFEPDGSGEEVYASGLRNAVGLDWQPGTQQLYATENGRDMLGDDFPPCELNRVRRGEFFGWPFANGDRIPDPDLGAGQETRIASSQPPAHEFRAHNAPLGMTFVRSDAAPPELRGAALVALHGSWNRSEKDGYKVVSLHWRSDGSIEERDFAAGFERNGDVIGRPVDVAEGPDGAIYVSDDYTGVVWRFAREAPG